MLLLLSLQFQIMREISRLKKKFENRYREVNCIVSIEASNEALAMLIGRVQQIPDLSALHISYLATICKPRNQRFHSFFSHYYENRTLRMRPRWCGWGRKNWMMRLEALLVAHMYGCSFDKSFIYAVSQCFSRDSSLKLGIWLVEKKILMDRRTDWRMDNPLIDAWAAFKTANRIRKSKESSSIT